MNIFNNFFNRFRKKDNANETSSTKFDENAPKVERAKESSEMIDQGIKVSFASIHRLEDNAKWSKNQQKIISFKKDKFGEPIMIVDDEEIQNSKVRRDAKGNLWITYNGTEESIAILNCIYVSKEDEQRVFKALGLKGQRFNDPDYEVDFFPTFHNKPGCYYENLKLSDGVDYFDGIDGFSCEYVDSVELGIGRDNKAFVCLFGACVNLGFYDIYVKKLENGEYALFAENTDKTQYDNGLKFETKISEKKLIETLKLCRVSEEKITSFLESKAPSEMKIAEDKHTTVSKGESFGE